MMKFNKKTLVLLACVALLLTFAVSGTVAYLVAGTDELVNTFTPSEVTVGITDNVSGGVKSNVVITNTGNIDAYIRAAIVGYWCNEAGEIVAAWSPTDTNQGQFADLPGTNWKENGGYYYYTIPVEPDTATEYPLFTKYTVGTAPNGITGAHLVMNILAQAIQAEPETTVESVWNVTVENGVIK